MYNIYLIDDRPLTSSELSVLFQIRDNSALIFKLGNGDINDFQDSSKAMRDDSECTCVHVNHRIMARTTTTILYNDNVLI